jgi:hypothetical protein
VFVSYLVNRANDEAQSKGRKTVSPMDILEALEWCEFGEWRPELEEEFAKYTEASKAKREAARRRSGKGGDGEGEHRAKKMRVDEVEATGPLGDETEIEGLDADETMGDDTELAQEEDAEEEEGRHDDEDEEEEEEEEDDDEEDGEDEEQGEGNEDLDVGGREDDDEALDNGEDSD